MEVAATKKSFRKYPAYKDSGKDWIGLIPSKWEVIRLKFVFEIVKRIIGYEGPDVLSITQRGIKIKDISSGEGQLAQDYSNYQRVEEGDFAMNHMDLLTGWVDISKYDGVVSPDYRVFKLKSDRFDKRYLLILFQMLYKSKVLYAHGQGVSMLGRWRLPAENFNNFIIPVPSKNEQTAIATFLNGRTTKIDQAIDQKERMIALLKERKQIIIQNAVTGKWSMVNGEWLMTPKEKMKDSGVEWIGDIPEHWEVKRLGNISKVIDPQPDHRAPKMDDNGLPYLGIRDINADGTINIHTARMVDIKAIEKQERAFKLEDGDLLYGKVGTLGNPKRLQLKGERVALSATLVIIKVKDEALSRYLKFALDSQLLYSQIHTIITGATRPALGIHQIRKFVVVCPPAEELGAFVTKLESILIKYDQAITLQQTQIEKLKEYKATLIDSAVTGKIKING